MNLVLLTHPDFLGLRSQTQFAQMLLQACRARGHSVTLRQPQAHWVQRAGQGAWRKWAGYIDQYLLFPRQLRAAMAADPADTLYVFCDQALGPWVPLAAQRPHVVHNHDLLALRSALGEVPENPTRFSGRVYQRLIRRGFAQARHFISISQQSRDDLQRLGGARPLTSEVVYNGLNHRYQPLDPGAARTLLAAAGLPAAAAGCLLHVGGGQWYKNTRGVVMLYASYARAMQAQGQPVLPLTLVSPPPDAALQAALAQLPAQAAVHFCHGLEPAVLNALYCHAQAVLFPSLAEGFGWPIAEALACGCPVLTTGEAPMTEVGGPAATYLPRLAHDADAQAWAEAGARVLIALLGRPVSERERAAAAAVAWAARFDPDRAIDSYLAIYRRVLAMEMPQPLPSASALAS